MIRDIIITPRIFGARLPNLNLGQCCDLPIHDKSLGAAGGKTAAAQSP